MPPKLLIFGFGYTASFVASQLIQFNFRITGTSRNKACLKHGKDKRIELIDFSRQEIERNLQDTTHLLISTPPCGELGDPVLANFIDLIKKYAPQMQWVGYLSSTGVYGDHQGAWVDESSATINLGKQAQLRLAAEKAWSLLAQQCQLPLHIFRIAGIYGPQRNALTRVAQGKAQAIYKENHYFSRIHVEDIAAVLQASIQNPNPFSIYNLADDEPTPSHEVDDFACQLLNLPPLKKIPFEEAMLSPMAREFYTHHKRVSNRKIKEELLVQLTYPTYRQGLQHLYDTGGYS